MKKDDKIFEYRKPIIPVPRFKAFREQMTVLMSSVQCVILLVSQFPIGNTYTYVEIIRTDETCILPFYQQPTHTNYFLTNTFARITARN